MGGTKGSAQRMWRAVHEVFDPIRPVTDPKLRVERETRYNPMVELDRRLRLPIGQSCYGVAGSVGSGKSTELLAVADRLTDGAMVVFVDLWRHFESSVRDPGALDHLQPWELIGLLGLGVIRAGTERFGHRWGAEREQLAKALGAFGATDASGPSVDVSKLAGGIAVAAGGAAGVAAGIGLKLLEAATDSVTWDWRIGMRDRKRSSDQEPQVRRVLDATNAVIDALLDAYDRKLVIVVDGLDRVRVAATFEDLFVESNLLQELGCDVIVCAELGLVQRYRARLRLSKTFELTNIPVARPDDPTADGAGIGFFEQVVRRRLDSMDVVVPEASFSAPMIHRLAWCSGGRLRDFMSLVREVAIRGLMDDVEVVSPAAIEEVVDNLRREREGGLNSDEIGELQRVLDDPKHRLPGGEVALTLLDKHLLLAYPNESTWYLPHPVLMLKLLRARPTTAG